MIHFKTERFFFRSLNDQFFKLKFYKMRKNNFILSAILSAVIFCLPSFLSAQAMASSPELSSSAKVGAAEVSMKWGAPSVKGRAIWGELVPFDKIWRTGANNATNFTTSKDVTINGKALAAGTYSVFTIPGKTEWTLIFNKKAEQWGAYDYKDSDDALRVSVTPKMVADVTEQLAFAVNKNGKVSFQWEKLTFDFTVASAK